MPFPTPDRRPRPGPLPAALGLMAALVALPAALAAAPVLGPEIQVNVSSVDLQRIPQVAVFPNGGFVVVWLAGARNNPQKLAVVHARLFNADGTPATGEFLLTSAIGILDGVATAGNDRFAVALESARGRVEDVLLQMFDRGGKPLTAPVVANLPSKFNRGSAVIAGKPDGTLVVAWEADQPASPNSSDPLDVFTNTVARLFSPLLRPLSGELTVATGTPVDLSGPIPDAIAFAPDGALLVTMTYVSDSVNVFGRRITTTGAQLPMDSLFQGDENCCGYNFDSSLAVAPDGSFAAVWDQTGPAASNQIPVPPSPPFPIQGRFFSADAKAQGDSVITVNRRPLGVRTTPRIAWQTAGDSGGFITVWMDESGRDGSGSGIFGRLLAADGTPTGGEFQVDQTSAGNQDQVQLAGGPNGAVAVWVSETRTNIYARLISLQ
jgi:large repetitive protein